MIEHTQSGKSERILRPTVCAISLPKDWMLTRQLEEYWFGLFHIIQRVMRWAQEPEKTESQMSAQHK